MNDITTEELQDLVWKSSRTHYKADGTIPGALEKCASFLQLDYNVVRIENENGKLSKHYPSCIFVPESEKPRGGSSPSVIYEQQTFDATACRELFMAARRARCRTRFAVPVILYRGKYVCRSATLSGGPEIYIRQKADYFFYGADDDEAVEVVEGDGTNNTVVMDWVYIDTVRQNDKKLIKFMNVGTIVDFMVENKKKKFGINLTSSEKVDKMNRYAEFNIISLPYPGCEFFKLYKDNDYNGEDLKFDWQQDYVDAKIYVPEDPTPLNIDWEEYQNWNLIQITQNYVKLILKNLRESSDGILVHCISGWDRTPLFISLLRILLWADGAIHQSLTINQMLYFTLAYDWFFFGHDLPNRISKGEDILFFCYNVLKYFEGDEYSTNISQPNQTSHSSHKDSVSSSASSSVCVARTDSASDVENMLCQFENPGSNLSLNSYGSCRSRTDSTSQLEVLTDCSNGNSCFFFSQDSNGSASSVENGNNSSNATDCLPRTSPVSVPTNTRNRTRNESFSSINGSWHVISSSGSLRTQEPSGFKRSINANSMESSTATVCDDIRTKNEANVTRLDRLREIRTMFRNIYFAKISTQKESFSSMFTQYFRAKNT